MLESWWVLKNMLIVYYDIALMYHYQQDIKSLSHYLFKMDSIDKSQSFLNHITQRHYN